MTDPVCPACGMGNAYHDGQQFACPDCFHEWQVESTEADPADQDGVHDANGNRLQDGDSVLLIKDLKVKGSSVTLKKGTKAKNIRLRDGDHEVDVKIDQTSYLLKACFLRKA